MWNWSDAKKAVEWLFWRGEVSAVRNPASFGRHYVPTRHVVPPAILDTPTPTDDDAMTALLLRAARSHGTLAVHGGVRPSRRFEFEIEGCFAIDGNGRIQGLIAEEAALAATPNEAMGENLRRTPHGQGVGP